MSNDIALVYTAAELVATGNIDLIRSADNYGDDEYAVFDADFTYNFSPALRTAGMVDGWSTFYNLPNNNERSDLIRAVLHNLDTHPEYGNLIRGGNTEAELERLKSSLSALKDALDAHPAATIR